MLKNSLVSKEIHMDIEKYTKLDLFTDSINNLDEVNELHKTSFSQLEENLEVIQKTFGHEITSSMNKVAIKIKNEISTKIVGNNISNDEVEAMIRDKVNRAELLANLDQKSNKRDTEIAMKSIEVIHKHTKTLLSVVIENLHQSAESFLNTVDSEKVQYERRADLYKQAMRVAKWVEMFDPNNIGLHENYKFSNFSYQKHDYGLKPAPFSNNVNFQSSRNNVSAMHHSPKKINADLPEIKQLTFAKNIESNRSLNRTSNMRLFKNDDEFDTNMGSMFKSVDQYTCTIPHHSRAAVSFEINPKTVRIQKRSQVFRKTKRSISSRQTAKYSKVAVNRLMKVNQ